MIDEIKKLALLSDFEINKLVATSLGLPLTHENAIEYEQIGDTLAFYDRNRIITTMFADYCNDPEAAYSIILENKISTYWKGGVNELWIAKTAQTPAIEHENPLRAAMMTIVILGTLE